MPGRRRGERAGRRFGEISYLNTFEGDAHSKGDFLLGWICSSIKGQRGHALAMVEKRMSGRGDPLFEAFRRALVKRLRRRYLNLAMRAVNAAASRLLPR